MTILSGIDHTAANFHRHRRASSHRRRGAIIVLVALLLPVLILMSGFAINFAYMELNRTELSIASDAAARASGREFALSGDMVRARTKARAAAGRNLIAGRALQLSDADIIFGESIRPSVVDKYTFNASGARPNAVKILGRRENGSMDGPIGLLMPNVFPISTFEAVQESRSTQVEVDVALVIDRSGSMAYSAQEVAAYPPIPSSAPADWFFGDPAPPGSRWLDTLAAASVFLNELALSPASELVSISTYNDAGVTNHDLSGDYDAILASLAPCTASFQAGGTNIASGINQGVQSLSSGLSRPWATKVILLMTDGIQTSPGDPISAAQQAAAQGVMVFTVSFSDEANQSSMESIAQIGLGKHFHATNASDLAAVFQNVAKSLPTLLTK